jgi:hypothetical protein
MVVAVILALLLLGGRDRGPDPAEVEFRPVPAPTQAEVVPVPALEPVPLAISETTPPPGWDPPDTAEEQLAIGLADLGREAAWQGGMAVVAILIVLGLMVGIERRRHG